MPESQVAVVGAGPAGVAAAVALKDRRLRPLLIDQADEVAPVWRARYDRLHLNTSRALSHLYMGKEATRAARAIAPELG
jgi:cation diffusion facilitator CzcD-associated flavoprotein CzcO